MFWFGSSVSKFITGRQEFDYLTCVRAYSITIERLRLSGFPPEISLFKGVNQLPLDLPCRTAVLAKGSLC